MSTFSAERIRKLVERWRRSRWQITTDNQYQPWSRCFRSLLVPIPDHDPGRSWSVFGATWQHSILPSHYSRYRSRRCSCGRAVLQARERTGGSRSPGLFRSAVSVGLRDGWRSSLRPAPPGKTSRRPAHSMSNVNRYQSGGSDMRWKTQLDRQPLRRR